MRKSIFIFIAFVSILCFSGVVCCEEPEKVTVCQLKSDPSVFNHKLVQVNTFVSHDFEDFTLFDPTCESHLGIWLEYGGKSKSDTVYCCGPTAGKDRPQELTIEGMPISLVDNKRFEQFDKLIQPPFLSGNHGSIFRAKIVGRFFAGQGLDYGKGLVGVGGYGHMGCCSLLAIVEVKNVQPQNRNDLDYGASIDGPDGCYVMKTTVDPGIDIIQSQQQADSGLRSWAFDDPQRVASEAIIDFAKLKTSGPIALKEMRKAPGRIVYERDSSAEINPYMVVVSRPYWLSFYAHNSKRVAWVVIATYELTCAR
jgi:hypothetical protein